MELKQRRRRRQRQRQKAIGLYQQNNNFARALRFFVHFLAVVAGLQLEVPNFTFCRGRQHKTTTFFFFSSSPPILASYIN